MKGAHVADLVRFGISLEGDLLKHFDRLVRERGYPTRSKAVEDLMRSSLQSHDWKGDEQVAGNITLIYDHHKRDLLNKLTDIQHDAGSMIISSLHAHLDHHHCLEVIVFSGQLKAVTGLADRFKAVKGVKNVFLNLTPLKSVGHP